MLVGDQDTSLLPEDGPQTVDERFNNRLALGAGICRSGRRLHVPLNPPPYPAASSGQPPDEEI